MADGSGSTRMRMWCWMPEKVQLHGAMLALQFGYAGFHVVSRAALNMGTSMLVFAVYRNIIALLLLLPFAYFLEKKERPGINLSFLVQFFLLALVGITANQGFYLLGLNNTSPTFASAVQNSVPALTFLMAAILRIEKVRLDRKDGIGKVMGTVLCVAGASVITLYKGPTVYTPTTALHKSTPLFVSLGDANGKNWTLGFIYLIGHCLSWSGWLVLQAPVLKKYPARLSVTSYTCFFGLIQFVIIAALFERDIQAWKFHSGGEVFSILYADMDTGSRPLNPNAKPWEPTEEKGDPDDRTIFITFSLGHPPREHQIRNFFTRYYGDCIEKIYLHQPNPRKKPMFGKVVFTKKSIPLIILGGEEEKHFRIQNKALWCKKYKRREERHPQQS